MTEQKTSQSGIAGSKQTALIRAIGGHLTVDVSHHALKIVTPGGGTFEACVLTFEKAVLYLRICVASGPLTITQMPLECMTSERYDGLDNDWISWNCAVFVKYSFHEDHHCRFYVYLLDGSATIRSPKTAPSNLHETDKTIKKYNWSKLRIVESDAVFSQSKRESVSVCV